MPLTRRSVATIALLLALGACAAPAAPTPAPPAPVPTSPAPAPGPPPSRTLRLDDSGVYGDLYLPAPAPPTHSLRAVLVIGGSGGGLDDALVAAELARRGFAALAVAYFAQQDEPRLPATLTDIPIEYFVTAAQRLAAQPEVDPAHVAVWGGSRGSEAAALLAGGNPALVHGVVLESPSSVVNGSLPPSSRPAWTRHGTPVPEVGPADTDDPDPAGAQDALLPIPAIAGPVVTVCGALDGIWDSCGFSAAIAARVTPASRVTALRYPDAGHVPVSIGVYYAAGTPYDPRAGGSVATDIAAATDALPRIVAALRAD